MIYCPKCGTANHDTSRFCSECGEELTIETQIECPRCGALNPIRNVLCSECNARLPTFAPSPPDAEMAPAIKGLSLPTKNPGEGQDEEPPEASRAEPEDDMPAWLRELGATMSEVDEADEADDLEDQIPDWLRDLRASLPEEPEDDVASEEEETLPDWLAAPESSSSRVESEAESSLVEPEIPDSGSESGQERAMPEPQQDEIPGWLSRLVPSAARGQEPQRHHPGEEESPGWLSKLIPGEEEAEPEAAPATPPEETGEPEWVAGLSTGEEAEIEAVPSAAVETEEPSALVDELPPADEEAEIEAVPSAAVETEEPTDLATKLPPTDEDAETKEVQSTDWVAPAPPTDEGEEPEAESLDLEAKEGEIPDWMAELQEVDEEAEAELPDLEIEEGEIPDWMAELQEVDEVEEELPDLEIEEGEIPDWLAALRPTDETAEKRSSDEAFAGAEFPDRVSELEPPSDEPPLLETLDATVGAELDTSDERTAFKLPPEVEAALGPAMPAWLAELQVEAPETAAAIIEETAVDGELPDWIVHSEIQPDESLAPAEIPGWLLALKPTALREEGEELPSPAVREWSEETGLLAGIPGTLPVEMLIAQPRAIAATIPADPTIEESPRAQLFSEIVGRPPDAAPKEIARPKVDVLPKTARWIIYAILIIVVAVPIVIGEPLLPRTIEPTAGTMDMYRAIESLDSGAPVLLAFDYDPTSSGEMDVVARTIIGHLMEREAKLVVVSLLPAGPVTAESMLEELAAGRPAYAEGYGESYVNLGYLPGQAAAVRILGLSVKTALPRDFYGTPLSDLPAMQEVNSAESFSLIVELAATQDTLRWWIEQAGTPYEIPLGTGASAAVAPFARPYYEAETRQLVGLVGGVPDAATYEALASGQNTPTSSSAARLDSQLAGQILLVLVILAGNVAYFTRRETRRER